jgi:UDP-GlcNAc:undecaprenyl-phosphate GlcNAc-1-phosphate transferase
MLTTSAIAALLVSSIAVLTLHRFAPALGLMDHPGERRKIHQHAVPPIGGLAIFTGLLAAVLTQWLQQPGSLPPPLGYGLLGAGLLVAIGALDDRFALGYRVRLLGQAGAALILVLGAGAELTALGDLLGLGPIALGPLAIPFSLFAIVGIINAYNMIDGIDGLAGGLALIALLGVLGAPGAGGALHLLLPLAVVAILPYLACNLELPGCRGRRVFLGDAGSMLLGYLVAWALIDASQGQGQGAIAPVTALWLVAVPLMDTLSVMGRRMLRRCSPFKADRSHLHHRLTRLLASPRSALALILAAAVLFAACGLFANARGVSEALMFYLALAVFALYLIAQSAVVRLYRLLHRRRRRALAGHAEPAAQGEGAAP